MTCSPQCPDRPIDRLDIHRPAEWTVVDYLWAQVLRLLGQAYVRRGDWRAARECLEQLRSVQKMGPISGLLDLLPKAGALKSLSAAEGVDEKALVRVSAILDSMTA